MCANHRFRVVAARDLVEPIHHRSPFFAGQSHRTLMDEAAARLKMCRSNSKTEERDSHWTGENHLGLKDRAGGPEEGK